MSLPWNRSLALRIGPNEVHGTLRSGWPGRTLLAEGQRRWGAAPQGSGGTDELATRRAAFDALLAELDLQASVRDAGLRVEIADELAHFDVVGGDFSASSDSDLANVAAACTAELLGDATATHALRWQLQADGQHLLMCALPSDLLNDLEAAAAPLGLRLDSAQPAFTTHWNQFRRELRRGDAVFAVATEASVLLARARQGVITALSSGPLQRHPAGTVTTSDASDSASGALLDARVDRFLSALGQADEGSTTFLLVAPPRRFGNLSDRWQWHLSGAST